MISTVLTKGKVKISDILSIGITNQRETVVMLDKETGDPIYNELYGNVEERLNVVKN